jgi:hypothetical protein
VRATWTSTPFVTSRDGLRPLARPALLMGLNVQRDRL